MRVVAGIVLGVALTLAMGWIIDWAWKDQDQR